jgi:hypothetical protein
MKRRILSALLALLTAASLPLGLAMAESASPVTNLKAVPYSATQVKVTWDGPEGMYYVNYGVAGGSFHYYDTVYTTEALINVAPETSFAIYISVESGAKSGEVFVTTPRASTQREYRYKYTNFKLYYVNANTHLDIWEDSSRTEIDRVQSAYLQSAGDLRDFHVGVEFTMSSAKSDKELPYVIVLYPPDKIDRFMSYGTMVIPADWTSVQWADNINYIFTTYLAYNDNFTPGRYRLELYLNGWSGGKTDFVIE